MPETCSFDLAAPLKQKLSDMLEVGIIEKFTSLWACPMVLVRKSPGDIKVCADYLALNEASQRDSYPLPNITEALDKLHKAKYFRAMSWCRVTTKSRW